MGAETFHEQMLHAAIEANTDERVQLRNVQSALSDAGVAPAAKAFLVGPDGAKLPLPEPLFRVLRYAAGMLARGERITLAPISKELSTQEAADLLGVSRPYLIKLLDAGDIPYTMTGRHRRVSFGDVNQYRNRRDVERRRRLEDLIKRSEDLGFYEIDEFELASTR